MSRWIRLTLWSAVLIALALQPRSAQAAGGTSTVEGEVVAPSSLEGPQSPYLGFIEKPIINPITALRPYDPKPEVFVYLEGSAASDEAKQPPKAPVVWALGSHSFSPQLLPVVSGTVVELSNQGRETHLLRSPDNESLLPAQPLGPGDSKQITVPDTGLIRIQSRDVPHLEARLVPVATRYYARLGRDGSFKIPDVPHGDWTLKIWYRDGWLAKTVAVTVGPKMGKVKVDLPEQLEPKAPATPAK